MNDNPYYVRYFGDPNEGGTGLSLTRSAQPFCPSYRFA